MYQIYVYGLETKAINCISNGLFYDFNPVFTKDGEYIIFISDRKFTPTYCDIEWEMIYQKVAGIYAVSLKRDGKSILPYRSDEENLPGTITKTNSPVTVRIDFEGIADRTEALPLKKGNYRDLSVNKSTLYYLNADEGNFNRFEIDTHGPMTLYSYSFDSKKETSLVEETDSYKLSADGESIIYLKDKSVSIMSSAGGEGKPVNLSELKIWYEPVREWKQIFNEAWRMERDYYYEPGMHGQDWNFMKQKYGKLADRASCRADLNFIIGEMIGELNTSHTYVMAVTVSVMPSPVNVGMLGADFTVDLKTTFPI